jgi:hypothetical protein
VDIPEKVFSMVFKITCGKWQFYQMEVLEIVKLLNEQSKRREIFGGDPWIKRIKILTKRQMGKIET